MGDVIVEGDDIHGDGVNLAARLKGLCGPGEVYVSGTVYDQAATFVDLGEQSVKNIDKPVRVYQACVGLDADASADSQVSKEPSLGDKPSIAILPFNNLSGDPDQDFLGDGVAEDIIAALSHFP